MHLCIMCVLMSQAYADVVMLYNNQEMIEAAGKGSALNGERSVWDK